MKRILKLLGGLVLALVIAVGLLYAYASNNVSTTRAKTFTPPAIGISQDVARADIALGKRIVTVRNGCIHCHGEDLAGKAVYEDPALGNIYSANITPYAIKDRTDEQLAMAIRHGVRPDGRSLVFMPSYEFVNLSRGDLAAAIAYLRSVPPVARPNKTIEIGPLAKVVYTLGQMPILLPATTVNHQAPFPSKPAEAASAEFGAYFANSACIGCHGNELKGGPVPGGPPDWPAAANLRMKGVSAWTQQSFMKTMQIGVSATSGKPLRQPMIEFAGKLNDQELSALWQYLSSLKP